MSAANRVSALQLETLSLQVEGPALVVTIDQPSSLNALSPAVIADLRTVVQVLRQTLGESSVAVETDSSHDGETGVSDWSIRGVILTGAGGKAFAAGADIRSLAEMTSESVRAYSQEVHELFQWIETLPVPVIAAVNGYALGGGCELALACDLIYASENAQFGLPEVGLGIIPGFGGCVRLQRVVGPALANEMIFTGRHVGAAEAERIGITARCFSDPDALIDAARDTVQQIAENSPAAVAQAKLTLSAVRSLPTDEGVAIELDGFANRFGSPDMIEGTTAFLEKRTPRFPGR